MFRPSSRRVEDRGARRSRPAVGGGPGYRRRSAPTPETDERIELARPRERSAPLRRPQGAPPPDAFSPGRSRWDFTAVSFTRTSPRLRSAGRVRVAASASGRIGSTYAELVSFPPLGSRIGWPTSSPPDRQQTKASSRTVMAGASGAGSGGDGRRARRRRGPGRFPGLGGAAGAEEAALAGGKLAERGDSGLAEHCGGSEGLPGKFPESRRGGPHGQPPAGKKKRLGRCDLCRVGATGLEPVTPSVSSWCSSQLS